MISSSQILTSITFEKSPLFFFFFFYEQGNINMLLQGTETWAYICGGYHSVHYSSPEFPRWLSGKESVCSTGDPSSIPKSGRSPGEGNDNSLQYSCLENSMDRGAWQAIVHAVAKELDTTQQLNNSSPVFILKNSYDS